MATFEGTEFINSTVELDGNTFRNCVIKNSVLYYRGGELPHISGCTIAFNRVLFMDSALRTVQFLHAMHAGGMKDVVDNYVKDITSSPPPHPPVCH
jgi:hypothetical protein